MLELSDLSHQVWDLRYRARQANGTSVDQSISDTLARVSAAIAQAEKDSDFWCRQFREILDDFKFIPAGRILAAAGTAARATLFNCFVMGQITDDLAGIFEHLREAAITLQHGGGVGYDFSTLRPRGAQINGQGRDSSGAVSFMSVWDASCRTIMSGGARRGAMMGTLRCDHPDIREFIAAKRDPSQLSTFNVSVLVSDAFMEALRRDEAWTLSFDGRQFGAVPARQLWRDITEEAHRSGEPGVIFVDRLNARNNLYYCETISATNPCGEVPLPPYGACLLGSINLAAFVEDPFSPSARVSDERLEKTARIAVRFLDDVIDVSRFPLEAQKQEAHGKRRIGLGVTGLADALTMLGIRYGSDESVSLVERWMGVIRDAAFLASADLAREKGPFPLYDRDAFLSGWNVRRLDARIRDAIAGNGIRNGVLLAIAPAGSISVFANNVSSGIEPAFALEYRRRIRLPNGEWQTANLTSYPLRVFRKIHPGTRKLPQSFVDIQSISPRDHIVIQSTAQRYVDAAISKTINVPADTPLDDFRGLYLEAYDAGCKGCTVYRPNAIRAPVVDTAASPRTADDTACAEECTSC